jgi:hypothetical protein
LLWITVPANFSSCPGMLGLRMKLISEYLADSLKFELLASQETNPEAKAELEKQAETYRRLAVKRAEQQGIPFDRTPE